MTTPTPPECVTCGFPNLRPEGHAEWCERVTAALIERDEPDAVCHRGHLFDEHNTYVSPVTGKRECRACRVIRRNAPAAAIPATSDHASAGVDEGVAGFGAPGPVVAEAIGQRPEHRLLVDAPAPQSKEATARTVTSMTTAG